MQITQTEALDLLHKWAEEEILISCCVVADADGRFFEVGSVLGRLKNLCPGAVRVGSICGPLEFQAATYLEIPLLGASYRYGESEPEPRVQLRIGLPRSCVVYELSVLPEGL